MSAVTFDTHKFVKTLEAAGLPEAQAEAISFAMRDSTESADLASKRDLGEAKLSLQRDIKELELRMDGRFEKITGEVTLIKWMLGLLIAGVASLVLKTFF